MQANKFIQNKMEGVTKFLRSDDTRFIAAKLVIIVIVIALGFAALLSGANKVSEQSIDKKQCGKVETLIPLAHSRVTSFYICIEDGACIERYPARGQELPRINEEYCY